jgi:DNA phosphorothioation-dependent restriction protein DptG
MYPFPEKLGPGDKNKLNSYLPIRNKGNNFNWDTITGMVLSQALKKQVRQYSFEDYKTDCKDKFIKKLDEPAFWQVLERMYFSDGQVFSISPLFLLFKVQRKGGVRAEIGAENQRMGDLFASLMGNFFFTENIEDNLNFIEVELLSVLQSRLEKANPYSIIEQAYLPYLAEKFQDDIRFLAAYPQYMLDELTNTLRLYAFAYCSQLALNIGDWKSGVPTPKSLFFILDTEKASSERVSVRRHGYKLFSEMSEKLFPLLSAAENFQNKGMKRPLWQIYKDCNESENKTKIIDILTNYIIDFCKSRDLSLPDAATSVEAAFDQIQNLAIQQFRDNTTTRADINKKYINELEKQIGGSFIQSRGRSGRTLVLNQDQLLLLTNLSIGLREKLRLHELIKEFQVRGFYLDTQSQQVLVNFYERMGNVERMSDSGDAVYVRKTI